MSATENEHTPHCKLSLMDRFWEYLAREDTRVLFSIWSSSHHFIIEVHRQKFFNWSLVTMPTPSRRRKSPNFFVFFGFDWEAKFFRYFSLNAMDFLLFSFVTWWEQLKEFMDFSFWCAKRELRVQLSKKTHRSRQLQDLFLSLNDSSIASSQVSEVLPPHHLDRHNAYITASIKELKLSYERSFLNCRS